MYATWKPEKFGTQKPTRFIALPMACAPLTQPLKRESMRYPAPSLMSTIGRFAGRKNIPRFHNHIRLFSWSRVLPKRRSRELKKSNNEPEWRQVQVVIEEATGKRIRQLVIQGPPDPDMNDFAVCVSFDDDTMISIELSLLLRFGIFYDRTVDGELQSVKEYPKRVLE
ncbi:MAG: hypothetical protein ACRD3K_14090 [Edaphobacter sp.]